MVECGIAAMLLWIFRLLLVAVVGVVQILQSSKSDSRRTVTYVISRYAIGVVENRDIWSAWRIRLQW